MQSHWKVVQSISLWMPLPFLLQPITSPGCPKQSRPSSRHLPIQGKRMCRLRLATATAQLGMFGKENEMTGTPISLPYLVKYQKGLAVQRSCLLFASRHGVDGGDTSGWCVLKPELPACLWSLKGLLKKAICSDWLVSESKGTYFAMSRLQHPLYGHKLIICHNIFRQNKQTVFPFNQCRCTSHNHNLNVSGHTLLGFGNNLLHFLEFSMRNCIKKMPVKNVFV